VPRRFSKRGGASLGRDLRRRGRVGIEQVRKVELLTRRIWRFEDRLLEERKKLMGQLGHLEKTMNQTQRDSSGDLSAYSFHMADMGTDAMEREKAFLLASSEGRLLMEVIEALHKLYSGEYGWIRGISAMITSLRSLVTVDLRNKKPTRHMSPKYGIFD
jgi:RNA polymerase-binding transcription factor DksA